jgi:hypothetical protein
MSLAVVMGELFEQERAHTTKHETLIFSVQCAASRIGQQGHLPAACARLIRVGAARPTVRAAADDLDHVAQIHAHSWQQLHFMS